MAPGGVVVNDEDMETDHERLMNNHSVNSFRSENNEFTVTRSIGDRKYSTMCFKPSERNMMDIIITQGEYRNGRQDLVIKDIGSQDIRRKYSKKAKLGVALVFIMLFVMLIFVLLCLLTSPVQHEEVNDHMEMTTMFMNENTTSLQFNATAVNMASEVHNNVYE